MDTLKQGQIGNKKYGGCSSKRVIAHKYYIGATLDELRIYERMLSLDEIQAQGKQQ